MLELITSYTRLDEDGREWTINVLPPQIVDPRHRYIMVMPVTRRALRRGYVYGTTQEFV